MAEELRIVISAQDGASKVLKEVSKAAGDLAKNLGDAGDGASGGLNEVDKSARAAAGGMMQLSSAGDGTIRSLEGVTGEISKMGAGLQSVGAALDAFGQSSIDQQRQIDALTRMYGDAAQEMIDFADQIQNTTLFSNDQARQAEIYFGTLKENYGLTIDQIKELMQVTADLAQVTGYSYEDVALRLQSAIRNETESAEALGLTLNQQSIDRENLTLTMSNQEAAQFRLNALFEQASYATGAASDAVNTANGRWKQFQNTIQDAGQSVGQFVGPVGDIVQTLGSGLGTVGEATRGLNDIGTAFTNLGGKAKVAQLATSAFAAVTSPLGLAITGVGLALGTVGALFLKHRDDAMKAQQAYENLGQAIEDVNDQIAQTRLGGDYELAAEMERMTEGVRTGIEDTVSALEASRDEMNALFSLDRNSFGTAFADYISSGFGQAAARMALEAGDLDQYTYDMLVSGQINAISDSLPQIQSVMDKYWQEFVPTTEDQAAIEQSMSNLLSLYGNENIDTDLLDRQIFAALNEYMNSPTPSVEWLNTELERIYESATTGADGVKLLVDSLDGLTDKQRDLEWLADDLRLDGLNDAADDILSLGSMLDDVSLGADAQAGLFEDAWDRINSAIRSGDVNADDLIADITDLYLAWKNGNITQEEFAAGVVEIAGGLSEYSVATDEATSSSIAMATAMGLVTSGLDSAAHGVSAAEQQFDELGFTLSAVTEIGEKAGSSLANIAKAALQGATGAKLGQGVGSPLAGMAQATLDDLAALEDALGEFNDLMVEISNIDPNLAAALTSNMGNDIMQLAADIQAGGAALDNAYRVIVSNTDAIKSQFEGLFNWADDLIAEEGTWSRLDELLDKGLISGEHGVFTGDSQYAAAQQAYNVIADVNEAVADSIDAIQVNLAPTLADLAERQAAYIDDLRELPAEQQLAALGWMDQAESARAYELATLAADAAAGKFGDTGLDMATQAIAAAAAADPVLATMLEQMGLISIGADGTITVDFSSVEDAKNPIDDLNTSIKTLIDFLDDGEINGSVDVKVDGYEQLQHTKELLEDLGGNTYTVGVEIAGNALDAVTDDLILTDGTVVKVPAELDLPDYTVTPEEWNTAIGPIEIPTEAEPVTETPEYQGGEVEVPVTVNVSAIGSGALDGARSAAQGALAAMGLDQDVEVDITANDEATPVITSVGELAGGLNGTISTLDLALDDQASGPLSIAFNNFVLMDGQTSTLNLDADISDAQAGINWAAGYDGSILATSYIDIVTRQTTVTGTRSAYANGGVVGYATGGVLFEAGEGNRPEMAHFATGGMALIPDHGLYSAPAGTYISPNNAMQLTPGMGGGITVNINVAGNVGVDDLAEQVTRQIVPAIREAADDYWRGQGVSR